MFKNLRKKLSKNYWIKNREVVFIMSLILAVIFTLANLILNLINQI